MSDGAALAPVRTGVLGRATTTLEDLWFDARSLLTRLSTGLAHHEGRFDGSLWSNWSCTESVRPHEFHSPAREAEVCAVVAAARRLRVVGGGHSFNPAPLCDDVLLSLDNYQRVLRVDTQNLRVRVQAGIRLRELNRVLRTHGLALPVLGSTDAQSLAGLISTDLHGTGRDHGFLSEQLCSLRLVDATGRARTVAAGDAAFAAAIGGAGLVGVITEAELRVEPAFQLRKLTALMDRERAEARLGALLAENDHVSFYYVGGRGSTRTVRINVWNRTSEAPPSDWLARKGRQELRDFVLSAFAPSIAIWLSKQPAKHWLSRSLAPDWSLVIPAGSAFGRQLFFRHDEIEYGVPLPAYLPCLREVMAVLEREDVPSIVETRFTPERSLGLLGPGVGRATAYIELATQTDDARKPRVFAETERILLRHGGQPHLGKWCQLSGNDLAQVYGERLSRLRHVMQQQDPGAKFVSPFLEQLLGATHR